MDNNAFFVHPFSSSCFLIEVWNFAEFEVQKLKLMPLLPDAYRYSLLVQHTEEELREFGLTDEMLIDQEW